MTALIFALASHIFVRRLAGDHHISLFAIFFAYILEAPISRLQGWLKGSRPAAIAVVYVVCTGALVLAFVLAGPPIIEEAQKLVQQAPELGQKITSGRLVQQLGDKHGWNRATEDWAIQYLQKHQGEMIATTQDFLFRAAKTAQSMWWLVLVPILAIFFLKDGHELSQKTVNSVKDPRARQMVADTIQEMNIMLGQFMPRPAHACRHGHGGGDLHALSHARALRVALGPAAGAGIHSCGWACYRRIVVLAVALLSGYSHMWALLIFLLVWKAFRIMTSPRLLGVLELSAYPVLLVAHRRKLRA